jgi:hypothetical protein
VHPIRQIITPAWEPDLADAVTRLCRQFPGTPRDAIRSVLGDSYLVVVDAAGRPDVDKAEELARLRLEVRTGRPAIVTGPELRHVSEERTGS